MPTISLAMIVRNESKYIERCINSVRGLVDQMVIVDTGSVDGTIELLHKNGVVPSSFEWCNDFSAARNESLKYCVGDWILVLDADEALARQDHGIIRRSVEGPHDLYEHKIRHYYMDGNAAMLGHTPEPYDDEYPYRYDDIGGRLFRNHIGLHYEGRLHEKLMPEAGLSVGWSDFIIKHYGKVNKAHERGKAAHYLELARQDYLERSFDPKCIFNYISHARIAGSWEDVAAGIEAYSDIGDPVPFSVAIIAGELAHQRGDYEQALHQYQDVLRACPTSVFALNRTAITLAAMGRLREAKLFAQESLRLSPGFTHSAQIIKEIEDAE